MKLSHDARHRGKFGLSKKVLRNFQKILVNMGNLVTDPGSGSGLEDSDPLTDRIPRSKDPDPDSV
jgi:hypothetical protein